MQQGDRSLEGHAPAMKLPVERGNVLVIVVQCHVRHYMAGVERMIMIGEVPAEVERAYMATQKAFEDSRAAMRPGMKFSELHGIAKQVFVDAGYPDIIGTVGLVRNMLDVGGGRIEAGNIRAHNDRPLQPGMIITIEPWAAIPGFGGHRQCDMVLVTEDGWEPLSKVDSGVLRVG
jgi:Xaa-Pro aminopeptidase